MKYKCYSYEDCKIIGLCNIKNLNKKLSEFTDKSWVNVVISKNINMPSNCLPIESIVQVSLSIKIHSTKIITKNFSFSTPNTEGLKLTDNILLVSGLISQNILYAPNSKCNSLHSNKFNIPFNTFINIDNDFNLESDKLRIYPCIENICIKLFDERNISESVNLFLFIHRIIGPIQKLLNSFVFSTFDSGQEMAKIEFNTANNKLIVSSTGEFYGKTSIDMAFKFELKNSQETYVKNSSLILANDNADDFKNALNRQNFEFQDVIILSYTSPSKAILTNYPSLDDIYTMPSKVRSEKFVITPNGIVPVLASNKIIVKSKTSQEVLNIKFTKESNRIIVFSTGVIPDPLSDETYFTLILKDRNGKDILRTTLNSNEDGEKFKNDVNGKNFEYEENSLTFIYKDKDKVEIFNYPTIGETYTPNLDFNIFKISPNNLLIDIAIKSHVKILNNVNEEIACLYFTTPFINSNITTIATATQFISTNKSQLKEKYVQYIKYSKESPNLYAEILSQENALTFKDALDGTTIQTNPLLNIIRLSNRLINRITISNYNNQDNYEVGAEPEFLEVNSNSLIPHNLNYNKIRFKNTDDSTILFIYFDKLQTNVAPTTTFYAEPYSTGIVNNDSDLFSFKITDPNEITIKFQGTINKGQNADLIQIGSSPYNISKDFIPGDILTLEYSNNSLIEIFDFPSKGATYNPKGVLEKFEISNNALLSLDLKDYSITFRGLNNSPIATLEFDIIQRKFIITSNGTKFDSNFDKEYFTFILKGPNGTIKKQISIKGTENANKFKDIFNDFPFEYDDVIIIKCLENFRHLLNYPPSLSKPFYFLFLQEDIFKIKPTSLTPEYNFLKNLMIIRGYDDSLLTMIRFNTDLKKLNAGSNNFIADSTFANVEYLAIIFKDDNGNILKDVSVKGNETTLNIASTLNNQDFNYNYTLTLRYKVSQRISVSNYPNDGDVYNPPSETITFIITQTGLKII